MQDDGEVVSDLRELEVDRCLATNITLGWSSPKVQLGEGASFTLNSQPNSICSLGELCGVRRKSCTRRKRGRWRKGEEKERE